MTEQTIIERAARVLSVADGLGEAHWQSYTETARAVLMAIQEPSEAMIEACDYVAGTECPKYFLKIRWQAMIDAALAE
jgi:hypothetical protein